MACSAWEGSRSGLERRARQVVRIWASMLPVGGGEGTAPHGEGSLIAGW